VPLHEKAAIRILNTILVFLSIFAKFDDIALRRLSSYPLENLFGFLRRSVHDVSAFTQNLTATAKSIIPKEGSRRLGIVDDIWTRASNSGVKIYKCEVRDAEAKKNVLSVALPEAIVDSCFLAAIILGRCGFDPSLITLPFPCESSRFLIYFEYVVPLCVVTMTSNIRNQPNIRFISTSGRWIMALLRDHD
jgi:hypothetical protein